MSKTSGIIRSIALWIVTIIGIFLLSFLLERRNFSEDFMIIIRVSLVMVAVAGTAIIWSKK